MKSRQGQQHDDHMAARELHEWKDWPPATNTETEAFDASLASSDSIEEEPRYVIAKSDSVEHLYYAERNFVSSWVVLAFASQYGREAVTAMPEPQDGFWMPLERAQELEQ